MKKIKATLIKYDNEDSCGEIIIKHKHPKYQEKISAILKTLCKGKRKLQYIVVTELIEVGDEDD